MVWFIAAALAANPACDGATPGECVEYTHFPTIYATPAEAEESCASWGGTWRMEGCSRDAATWRGECRKPTWSKHYYSGVAGESALPTLCVEAERGTWLGTAPAQSDYDYQWERWKKKWDTPSSTSQAAKFAAMIESDPLKALQVAGGVHQMFELIVGKGMEDDWARVRSAAEAAGEDPSAREAEKALLEAKLHAETHRDVMAALVVVLPVLRGAPIDPADSKRSDQLSLTEILGAEMIGHLSDPAPACRVLAAAAGQRLAREEKDKAVADAAVVRARCTDAEALTMVERIR